MATTTNFGWETPDDTDLVKDGAAAMRTLGNAIDTSFVDLKGGTTNQVLAKNSNSDLDFKWVTENDADAIQNTIVDAKGDLISATAADTPARLAVGTNGQVLTANSSTSTGLEWTTISSGGETLISTTVFSGSAVDLTSIPNTYKHLRLEIVGFNSASAGDSRLFVRINSDTNAVYNWSAANLNDGAAADTYTEADSRFDYIGIPARSGASDDDKGYVVINFWNYASTSFRKFVTSRYYARTGGVLVHGDFTGLYFGSNNAISTINLTGASGATTLTAGTAYLYGIK